MTSIIKSTSNSFFQIEKDIKNDILTIGGEDWSDYVESANGKILIRMLSAVATYNSYHYTVNRFESSLELARHETSVIELAFNRGFLLAPTKAANLKIQFNALDPISIAIGEVIGYIGKYNVYSLESYSFTGLQEVNAVVGNLEEFEFNFSDLKPFTELNIEPSNKYIATDLEQLTADGEVLNLQSDIDFLNSIYNNFLLRRVTTSNIHIYIGNGILGWYDNTVQEFKYRCVSFDKDILDSLTSNFVTTITPSVVSYELSVKPTFSLEKETIRRTASYYPLDGRAVQENDYEAIVIKYFGGSLYDVYSYNIDPHEVVLLLPKESFVQSTIDDISDLIDTKRGLNIEVYYLQIPYEDTNIDIVRGSGDFDELPDYLNESVDSVVQDSTILEGYTIKREGVNNRNYTNKIYWNTSTSPPVVDSTYTVRYKPTGVTITLLLKTSEENITQELLDGIDIYLDNKLNLFQRDTEIIKTIDLAIELTKELGVNLYPEVTETTVEYYNYIKEFNVSVTKL